MHLDDFDRRILARYQRATRTPAAEIGAEVGLSEAAHLSPSALGFPVTCLVGVDLRDEAASELDRFKARMWEHAEVQQCYYVTGQWDFMLVVHVALDRVKVGIELSI
jgi:DNA-binding Lrp family transcriptional regulator